jgi:hypothetical protein
MEDCGSAKQDANWIRSILSDSKASKKKEDITKFVGAMLGAFFAQLQMWGVDRVQHSVALRSFGGNISARDIIIQEIFTDFFANLERTGVEMSFDDKGELQERLDDLKSSVRQCPQSVSMGDLWCEHSRKLRIS